MEGGVVVLTKLNLIRLKTKFSLYMQTNSKTPRVFMLNSLMDLIYLMTVAIGLCPTNLTQSGPLKLLTQQLKSLTSLRVLVSSLSTLRHPSILMVSGFIHFLTLKCSDGALYEAKIYMPITGDCKLKIFRPAKYWPWLRKDKNTNEEDDTEPEGSQIIGKKRKVKDTNEGGVGG
ncbi:hypothetical protein Dsin_009113 [Dipteronia sinensis]|uniref:Uncharacterized protein n=1 Tax=Dipteronia sinensis TaxID=43782 RepID=A0AAE0AQ05_9ROSI|nr:hypothetical protein Dsin_009113 [Dipteronia sinensis]